MNFETSISSLEKYSLYDVEGQELLRQLLKSYSLQGGGNNKDKADKRKIKKIVKQVDDSIEAAGELLQQTSSKDYVHRTLSSEIKDFMKSYKNKPRPDLMTYLNGDVTTKYTK